MNADDITKTLRCVCDGSLTEIRLLKKIGYPKTVFGYFDDYELVANEIRKFKYDGAYFVLNEINDDLRARNYNKLREASKGETTGDQHVIRRRWLPVDLDPERIAGISSSANEKLAAADLARVIFADLRDKGWPDPIVADSGNGMHLLYRIDVPTDDNDLVKRVLNALDKRYSSNEIKVDTACFNPARIFKLYGTKAAKGEDIPERPHRISKLLSVPDEIKVTTVELLEQIATPIEQPKTKPTRSYAGTNEFDIEDFIRKHIEVIAGPKDYKGKRGGRMWDIVCPFNSEHRGDANIIEFEDGSLSASCFHNSCSHVNWRTLREHVEPGCYDKPAFDSRPLDETEASTPIPTPIEPEADVDPLPEPTTLRSATLKAIELVTSEQHTLKTCGISEIDDALGGGFAESEYVVIAARPSHGKSMFALQMLHEMTRDAPAILCSEEMSALALGERSLQYVSEVHKEHWFHSEEQLIQDVDSHFGERHPTIVLENLRSVERIADAIELHVKECGATTVVVDYLQLLKAKGGSRYEAVTEVSMALRRIINKTGVTLIALAQLGREVEKREKFMPKLSDLKESGQIEQDADVIMSLCWPHRIDSSNPFSNYQVFFNKNRNRGIPTPLVHCDINPSRQLIKPRTLETYIASEQRVDAFDDFNSDF